MNPLALLVLILATYRLAYMIAVEEGPFSIFLAFRDKVGQASWLGRGFHCVLCISFWLSLLLAYWLDLRNLDGGYPFWLLGLGIAGGVLVLYRGILGGHD